MKHEIYVAVLEICFLKLSHTYKGVCMVSMYSLKKRNKTDTSVATAHVKKRFSVR